MLVIDRHFVDAYAVVLLNAVRVKRVDIGLGRSLVQLPVQKPACEITQDDLDAEFQETARAVDADKSGSENYDILACFGNFLENFDIIDVAESDHIGGSQHVLDRREECVGAGRDQELVIADSLVAVQDDLFLLSVKTDRLSALHPIDLIQCLEVLLNKAKALKASLAGQVLVENAAGVDILVLGDQNDLTLLVQSAQLSDGVDARCGRTDDNILHISFSPPRE